MEDKIICSDLTRGKHSLERNGNQIKSKSMVWKFWCFRFFFSLVLNKKKWFLFAVLLAKAFQEKHGSFLLSS